MSVKKREVLTGRQKIMPKINEEIDILLRKIEKICKWWGAELFVSFLKWSDFINNGHILMK